MKKLLLFCCCVLAGNTLLADEVTVTAKLVSANVFREGAELLHTAKANLAKGANQLTIEGLSESVDVNSIRVKTSGGATVLSSEFSTNYLSDTPTSSQNIQKLKDSIAYYEKEKTLIAVNQSTNNELLSLLKANKNIGGTQNGVSVDELTKMMNYYKTKSIELENEKSGYEERLKIINVRLTLLRKQVNEELGKGKRNLGRLVLQLNCLVAVTSNIELTYFTNSASWQPYYELNVENVEQSSINVAYKAKLSQSTGLDWKKVKLSLSTATPNTGKTAPIFSTWFLEYTRPQSSANYRSTQAPAMNQVQSLKKETLEPSIAVRGIGSLNPSASPLYLVNGEEISEEDFKNIDPAYIKEFNVLKDAAASSIYGARASNGVILVTLKDDLENYVSESGNTMDVTYDIALDYDIQGNGSENIISIKQQSLPVVFKYYSAPKLEKAAYLMAEVKNWETLNLLPGEANITFEGTYIGRSFINPLATSEALNLTLSNDKRVVVKREKMKDFSSTKFLGNVKTQNFAYKITVKNTKNSPVDMILKDQYPISTLKEIEVELLSSDKASVNEDIGVLTWMFTLKPGETKEFIIKYSVKYPKNKILNL